MAAAGWTPRQHETFIVSREDRNLYDARDPGPNYRDYQFPHRKGIDKRGESPAAVVRKAYANRGYDCWISAQAKHGVPSYLQERIPGKRRAGDAGYVAIRELFGCEAIDCVHQRAAARRQGQHLRARGGDPDLFVRSRLDPTDRFFVEVKLEDPYRRPPYRDQLNKQQLALFPVIEEVLRCEVRIATVSIRAE